MAYLRRFAVFAVSFCLLICLSLPVQSSERQYRTKLHESSWSTDGVTSFECHLIHPVPLSGEARFSQYAGETVQFKFQSQQIFVQPQAAQIRANPPSWRHDLAPFSITQLKLQPGHEPLHIKNEVAGRMLQELENGRETIISYKDQSDGRDHILVAMSPVNFRQALETFRDCQSSLLAFKPADVIDTMLYFETDKAELLPAARQTLKNAVKYLSIDPSYLQIAVTGHADARGRRRYNDKLSERRAQAVKEFLVEQGIEQEKVVISYLGERKPVATNRTSSGRALNRRVHFQLLKEPPPPMEERRNARYIPWSERQDEQQQTQQANQSANQVSDQSPVPSDQPPSAQEQLPLSADDEENWPDPPNFIDKSLLVKPGG